MPFDNGPTEDHALATFYEIGKLLAGSLDVERSLHNVLNLLASYMYMRKGCVAVADEDGELTVVAAAGVAPERLRDGKITFPRLAARQVITTGMPIVISDIRAETRDADGALPQGDERFLVSYLAVPIKAAGERPRGILSIYRVWDGQTRIRFDRDVQFLTMAANLIGQTLRLREAVAADRERMMLETHRLQKKLNETAAPRAAAADGKFPLPRFVGESPAIREVTALIRQVATTRATVLLRGETGTGKEVFARALHELSPRRDKPFVKVNCAALSETLLESELFGHEKGSFTGAVKDHKGRFELAHGGTLFLDEIGEISPTFQAKLLRVLQEGEFERVGGTQSRKVDVRLVFATNRNLEEEVAQGKFRADLYYRISVVPVFLPPLRERRGDIGLMAGEFLRRFNAENGRDLEWSPPALRVLEACAFPGNVRELENCVSRVGTLAHGKNVAPSDLACQRGQCLSAALWRRNGAEAPVPLPVPVGEALPPPEIAGENSEPPTDRETLVQAMERAGWVQAKAARILNLTPRQIGYALKKHGVPIRRF